jgi:hypothetical protein
MAKQVKNRFGFNPTGGQIDKTFGVLCRDVLKAIVYGTSFAEKEVPHLLAYLANERRCRRTVNQPPYALQFLILATACNTDKQKLLDLLDGATIERSVWCVVFGRFNDVVSGYIALYRRYLFARGMYKVALNRQLEEIENKIGATRDSAVVAIQEFQSRYEMLRSFLEDILFQFTSMGSSMAARHSSSQPNISYKDLQQDVLASLFNGTCKYSSNDGALANYLKYWVINSLNGNGHQTGLAYTVSTGVRKKIAMGTHGETNFSISLDTPLADDSEGTLADVLGGEDTPETDYIKVKEQEHLSILLKVADPAGVFRAANGISEFFNPGEIRTMEAHMASQGLNDALLAVEG